MGISALPPARALGEAYLQLETALPFDLVPTASDAGLEAAAAGRIPFHLDYPPAPDGWFATTLAWEGIAFIVHPQVPTRNLTLAELEGIFSGEIREWGEVADGGGEIQPVLPPPGDRFRQAFLQRVMPESRVSSRALVAPNPETSVEWVSTTEGALGLLPLSYRRPATVPLVRIEGSLPGSSTVGDGSYPLRVQLLALAPQEPVGSAREWLLWAQLRADS